MALHQTSSPQKQPRTQEQRRRETNAALMRAGIDLLTEVGYARLTMADVATRSGMSRGALNHYFPIKEEFLVAAARFAMETEMQRIQEEIPAAPDRASLIAAFFNASERFFLTRSFTAQIELAVASRTNPAMGQIYRPLAGEFRAAFDARWQEALCGAGLSGDDAKSLIDMTNFFLRGMGLLASDANRQDGIHTALADFKQRMLQVFG